MFSITKYFYRLCHLKPGFSLDKKAKRLSFWWFVLCSLFFLVLLVIFAGLFFGCTYLLNQPLSNDASDQDQNKALDQTGLNKLLAEQQTRRVNLQNLETTKPVITDPGN